MKEDIKDGVTADLYITMSNLISKIETYGELDKDDVDKLDLRAWTWLQEKELEEEMNNER